MSFCNLFMEWPCKYLLV